MGIAERRYEIMKILCRRRYDTIRNLASEFGVSMRTVQRDIEALSRTEPIYTQFGKYGGGVYVVEGYSMDRMYMKEQELDVLRKLYIAADEQGSLLVESITSMGLPRPARVSAICRPSILKSIPIAWEFL